MVIRTLVLITLLLCSSAPYAAADSDHSSDPKTVKVEKDKEKDKKEKSVPAPPALMLLGVAAGVAGLHRLRERRRARQPR